MKKFAMGLLAVLALLGVNAAASEWLTDLPKVQAQAKEEKKMVLLDFTGSDWCGWCIKLHNEVFSKPEFAEYARKNLVLVEVDFPRKKKLGAEQKKANEALQQKYKIEGYPTIIVLNGEGKKIGELGLGTVLGAAQLLFLATPAHAAVDTSVQLAQSRLPHLKGLTNAVLRRVVREGKAIAGRSWSLRRVRNRSSPAPPRRKREVALTA